jgi:hypothetical protein
LRVVGRQDGKGEGLARELILLVLFTMLIGLEAVDFGGTVPILDCVLGRVDFTGRLDFTARVDLISKLVLAGTVGFTGRLFLTWNENPTDRGDLTGRLVCTGKRGLTGKLLLSTIR